MEKCRRCLFYMIGLLVGVISGVAWPDGEGSVGWTGLGRGRMGRLVSGWDWFLGRGDLVVRHVAIAGCGGAFLD